MHINDDHMYHGAALTQIAEHPDFTAINAFNDAGTKSRCAFRINGDTGTFIKYARAPTTNAYEEYVFTFTRANLDELEEIAKKCRRTFVVLVCVREREVCVLSRGEFNLLILRRKSAYGGPEAQYNLLVTARKGKKFCVYVNSPGVKGAHLAPLNVARRSFPNVIFEQDE
jgi:hypothetical protein